MGKIVFNSKKSLQFSEESVIKTKKKKAVVVIIC